MRILFAIFLLLFASSSMAAEVKKGTEEWFNALDLAYEQSAECNADSNQVKQIQQSYQSKMNAAKAQSNWDEFQRLSQEMSNKMKPIAKKGTECAAKWLKENKGIILEQ